MPKVSKTRRSSKNKNRKRAQSSSITAVARPLKSVPTGPNQPVRIRRSWTQDIAYYGGTGGWANSGNLDFQINFAASQSEVRIGGVLVYGPSTPNSTELSNLFDQYRIMGVTVRIDWDYNSFPVSGGTNIAPLLYYVADYDDSGSAIVSGLLQYSGVRTHSFMHDGYTPLITYIKPKPLRDVAGTGVLTSYGPMSNAPWLRTAEMTTPHYGLKFCSSGFSLGGTTLTGTATITSFIDMEFVNPK